MNEIAHVDVNICWRMRSNLSNIVMCAGLYVQGACQDPDVKYNGVLKSNTVVLAGLYAQGAMENARIVISMRL